MCSCTHAHTHTHSFLLVILSASVLRQQSGLGAVTGGAHGGPRCGDSRHPTGPPKEVPEGTFKTSSWCFGAWEWGRGRGWNCGTALALAFVTGHLQRQLSSTPADLPDGRGSASGHHKGPASPWTQSSHTLRHAPGRQADHALLRNDETRGLFWKLQRSRGGALSPTHPETRRGWRSPKS